MFEHFSPHAGAAGNGSPPHNTDVVGALRSRLLRIAVLPTVAMALLGAAAAALVAVNSSPWMVTTVLAGWMLGCAVVLLAAVGRAKAAVGALREQHEEAAHTTPADPPSRSTFGDAYGRQREVFANLAGRLQSLIQRAIVKVDELEHEVEDPDLLKGLFSVDHLATRVRRQAENLAVLGGEPPQRQSTSPVSIYAVLRSAVAEIEHYARVKVVHPVEGTLRGHAVAEFIHLLAELLENATSFSAPDAPVMLRAQNVTAGLAIEVQDRGLGIPVEDLDRINHLLGESGRIDLGELFEDGRIGLSVVRELAHRHGVSVRLQTNIFGGIDAIMVLPHNLLGDASDEDEPHQTSQSAPQEPHGQPTSQQPQASTDRLAHETTAGPGTPQSTPRRGPQPTPETTISGELPRNSHTRAASPADPSVSFNGTISAPSAGEDDRPPLPKRRRTTSHMRAELHERSGTNPIPGHDPQLMATFRKGLGHEGDE
ncbi:sensor histidine kinase [Haloactinomyces albus]|uniref:histidine kinase n=1 Tax=Haloactinomyces albus TaxID=1352928 RepID=A0AAE4CQE5_9ACTN|nr:ATP-binding protein [Haloactinomyces albus]MDR7304062.1 signal transduction histidine kinase [Haloactinomyces albus]